MGQRFAHSAVSVFLFHNFCVGSGVNLFQARFVCLVYKSLIIDEAASSC